MDSSRVRVVGLISGTSMDGIDVAVADLRLAGGTIELAPLGHTAVDYPAPLRAALLAALPPGGCTAEQLCRLDTEVGQAFAAAAGEALASICGGTASLVASLGQTIYHWVDGGRCRGTLQLGQPAWIAEATGLPVVADLRARDVAAGGHGAPLAGILDRLWLADLADLAGSGSAEAAEAAEESGDPGGFGHAIAALNIGGIANITVVAPDAATLAFDTGPGNALLDAAARMTSDGARHYDADGRLAARGTVRPHLLERLLAEPYYAAPAPKSTGKELFHEGYLRAALSGLPPVAEADLLATLVELTAVTVAEACRAHGVRRVVASGGGVRNPVLMAAMARRLAPATLSTSDELGLPVDAKEAYLTALLGFLTWHGVPADSQGATGAAGPRLLGSITPGRTPVRLPEPTPIPVTRLRVAQLVGGLHGRT